MHEFIKFFIVIKLHLTRKRVVYTYIKNFTLYKQKHIVSGVSFVIKNSEYVPIGVHVSCWRLDGIAVQLNELR